MVDTTGQGPHSRLWFNKNGHTFCSGMQNSWHPSLPLDVACMEYFVLPLVEHTVHSCGIVHVVGADVGCFVATNGSLVGLFVGAFDGCLGVFVGGFKVGEEVGPLVGDLVGGAVGDFVGVDDTFSGALVGCREGDFVGGRVGRGVG